MSRCIIDLSDLSVEDSHLLIYQAMGIADAKMRTDFMSEKTAMLAFAEIAISERLCVTAAIRQMSGNTIYQEAQNWEEEIRNYQQELLSQMSFFIDCLYLYGFPIGLLRNINREKLSFPVVNAGCKECHPVHCLADICCILADKKIHFADLENLTVSWVGNPDGVLFSLLKAYQKFPLKLKIAIPNLSVRKAVQNFATKYQNPAEFVNTPREAFADSDYIYVGAFDESLDEASELFWRLQGEDLLIANKECRIFMGVVPPESIFVGQGILSGPNSLFIKQAEYRLRVHKRILHFLFSDEQM